MTAQLYIFHFTDLGLRLCHQSNHTAYKIRDNSVVRLAALGTLFCTTPYKHCCQNRGHWHYPNESVVPTSQDGSLIFTSRTDHRRLDLRGELVSIMKVQMVSMSVKFLMRMEELRLSILGFTVDLSVSYYHC